MKKQYDFSNATRGKFAARIPPDAVFVRFDADISALLSGAGDFTSRVRSLARVRARGKGGPHLVRSVALSPREYLALKPIFEKLGATVTHPPSLSAPLIRPRRAG